MFQSRLIRRWISTGSALSLLAVGLASLPTAQAATTYTVYNSPQGRIDGGEIVDITPDGSRAFIAGFEAGDRRLYAITVNPLSGLQETRTDLTTITTGRGLTNPVPSSVSVHPSGKYAFVTIREEGATTEASVGFGIFVTIGADGSLGIAPEVVQLGVRPEHVDIAPNGEYAVVANEGANTGAQTGSIQIVDLDPSGVPGGTVAKTFDASTLGAGTRPDPEAVAISPNSARAYVTIQTPGDIAIIDIDSANLAAATITVDDEQGAKQPDGLAVSPDGGFVIVANEGTSTVTLYQVGGTAAAPALVQVANPSPGAGTVPEMVAIGTIGGVLKAAVSLENTDAVAMYNLNLGAAPSLELDTIVRLNPGTQVPGQPAGVGTSPAYGPEGIAIATTSTNVSYIVTANGGRSEGLTRLDSDNVSVIVANSTEPQPVPGTERVYLPLVLN